MDVIFMIEPIQSSDHEYCCHADRGGKDVELDAHLDVPPDHTPGRALPRFGQHLPLILSIHLPANQNAGPDLPVDWHNGL